MTKSQQNPNKPVSSQPAVMQLAQATVTKAVVTNLAKGLSPQGIVHFTGIGGIGMSGIAETMYNLGFCVQGSDRSHNANILRLQKLGVKVVVGEDLAVVERASVLVYSSAVGEDHVELRHARALRIPIVRRAEILAELMRFKTTVAVAGTHGKTTTTSLVATMLENCGLDPTVINGGIINAFGSNARKGESAWMVVEADESDGSFLHLRPTIAIVTNIDPEHLENYDDFEHLQLSFRKFVQSIPFYGFAILCVDHPIVQKLVGEIDDRRILTYGFSPQALYRALDVRIDSAAGMRFSIEVADEARECRIENIALPMFGEHNVLNALAASTLALRLDLPPSLITQALENFKGVKRRFTKLGALGGITVIDDYAHHPVEITAVLKAARPLIKKDARLRAVYQPHRYSRLSRLFEDFCRCFNDADQLYVTPVYAAEEKAIEGASSQNLVDGLRTCGHRDVRYSPSIEELTQDLLQQARAGDYIVFLGAGSITQWAQEFFNSLQEHVGQKPIGLEKA